MADLTPKLGQTIETQDGRSGVVRYIGTLHIAAGNWLGLELADAAGKNDGSVKGERYFTCQPAHGIFVRKESMVKILKQPIPTAASRPNGAATAASGSGTRPRPTSSISADVARKRQSLMSNGSGSATGSRLSMRSPTKPPSASTSSATSTPRTGTPATTVRNSDSSTKSRLSVAGRPSMGLPAGATRPSPHISRPSVGGSNSARGTATARPAASSAKAPLSGPIRPSQHARTASKQEKPVSTRPAAVRQEGSSGSIRSPKIDEESERKEVTRNIDDVVEQPADEQDDVTSPLEGKTVAAPAASRPRTVSTASRAASISNLEARTAQLREIEQLKAKIRTLEKNREEDRDNLKQVENLRSDKDRFENIIQALQKKLKANQQELTELRKRCEQAEAQANATPERLPEHESEIELATLDKEMAEERAETYQMELEALKAKHEELELEAEILREENKELASTMSPEEKASAGWLQMERERERLRDALVMLRDMTQQNESELKAEIHELRENLDEVEKTAGLYVDTAEKLARAEETTRHLKDQLEALESNDEVVEAMETQREQQMNSIEQLKGQIQDLEEHIQVTDELEIFHVEEEKRLHAQLDESEALLNESNRKKMEQDRVIEDLEYTLTKFRDVVQGLQSDIDELRRSREISELQANEMSSKSRAMMDLNLRLQNNAAKSQTKYIDIELNKVNAELASKHVDILNLFTLESFDVEKKPILALLCFGRLKYKASLVGRMLGERLRERSHLSSHEEGFKSFETMERMEWISGTCRRFEKFMNSCTAEEFAACSNALYELDPVERTVSAWIEALRRDELANDPPEHLKRMQGILVDLSEKLISESSGSRAIEMLAQMEMVERYAESIGGQFTAITRMVQTKLGSPTSEDEESLVFDKRMDQLATKARTVKYLSGKVVQSLNGLYNSSLCLGETSWPLYEEAEGEAEALAERVRSLGLSLAEEINKLDRETPLTYASIPEAMTSAMYQSSTNGYNSDDDAFMFLSAHLGSLQSFVDDLQNRSGDLSNATEFELQPAPWTVRAKQIKSTKIISPETQEELTRLERRNGELGSKIAEREKTIEEMGMRVEIAEKRFKESRERDTRDKALKDEVDHLKSERQANEKALADLKTELIAAMESMEQDKVELEALRKTIDGKDVAAAVAGSVANTGGQVDESIVKQFELEANLLQAEIVSLQAAIRCLREENRSLRIPVSEVLMNSARNSWLNGNIGKKRSTPEQARRAALEREGVDVWAGLIDVAKSVKPIRLSTRPTAEKAAPKAARSPVTASDAVNKSPPASTWQPTAQTTRYAVLKQREELEHWEAWRVDYINRAKVAVASTSAPLKLATGSDEGGKRARTRAVEMNVGSKGIPRSDGSNLTAANGVETKAKATAAGLDDGTENVLIME